MINNSPKVTAPFILLAEDDVDDQELLIEALTEIDRTITVKAVSNGRKAISFLEALQPHEQPALIILDYNLPELNGADVLEHLYKANYFNEVTKIVWSTSNSPIYEKACLDLGAKAYLVKPSDISGIQRLARLMLQMCALGETRSI